MYNLGHLVGPNSDLLKGLLNIDTLPIETKNSAVAYFKSPA